MALCQEYEKCKGKRATYPVTYLASILDPKSLKKKTELEYCITDSSSPGNSGSMTKLTMLFSVSVYDVH